MPQKIQQLDSAVTAVTSLTSKADLPGPGVNSAPGSNASIVPVAQDNVINVSDLSQSSISVDQQVLSAPTNPNSMSAIIPQVCFE